MVISMTNAKKKVPSKGTRLSGQAPLEGPRLFEALRRALKARALTYADLAERLGMSESGVKKMFASEDCTVARLESIAGVLSMTLADLFDVAARPTFEHVKLTAAQQDALLAEPLLLDVFWKLTVERWPLKRIAAAFRLDAAGARRVVGTLDRLGLVALEQPGDRIRLLHGDLVRWLPEGPLLDHLHRVWGRDVLDRARAPHAHGGFLRLHQLALRRETRRELEAELAALLDRYLDRARREALTTRADDAPLHGLLLAVAEGSFVRPRAGRSVVGA